MKRKKWISLTMALMMIGNLLPMNSKADAASISDDVWEDIIAINSYLLGILVGTEAVDINEDGCINAVDLTLAKRDLLGDDTPALKPLRADTWDIYLNEEATVTVTVQTVSITDPVILYDEADNVLAEMHDDGENGDETAGDSIYTATAVLSSDKIKNAGYYAAAGELRSEPFEICFYRDLEEAEIESFSALLSQISEMAFDEAAEFIAQSDEISDYTIDEEQKQIWYQSVCGLQGCFIESQESEFQTLGTGIHIDVDNDGYDYDAAVAAIASNTFTPAHPDKRDVIVLRPFQENKHNGHSLPDAVFSEIGELLADALDSTLTDVYNQDVTLEQLKSLDSYGTVLFNTHGILITVKDQEIPFLVSGEDLMLGNTDFFDVDAIFNGRVSDYLSGRITCATITDEETKRVLYKRIAVSSKFFDKYYDSGSLNHSFWFFGACNSIKDDSIANALISKGAGSVVGFSNVTSTNYCYQTLIETVINSMVLEADDVQNGVYESKRRYGWTDPITTWSQLRFRGQPHFKLVEAAGDNTGSSNIYTYNGHDYSVITSPMTWSEAEAYCEMHGGHLATVTSEGEERFIEQILPYYRKKGAPNWDFWLGATDEKEEGTWEWVTGEEFSYNKWRNFYEPDNRYRREDGNANWLSISTFVLIANGKSEYVFEWEDAQEYGPLEDFNYKRCFICEWE